MSVRVMTWVFDHAVDVSGNHLTVLLAIADRCNDEGYDAYPSIEALAGKVHCHRATVIRAIQHLEAIQLLRVTREEGERNRYVIIMQPRLPMAVDEDQEEAPEASEPVHCDLSQSATRRNLRPVAPLQRPPVAMVRPSTSCTSSTPPTRARGNPDEPTPAVLGEIRRGGRRQAPGPLAGSLPRDHIGHGFCGLRLCVTATALTRYARRHSTDVEAGRVAVLAWLEAFDADLAARDCAAGDNLWLEDHLSAWLTSLGRVPPAPPRPRQATGPPVSDVGRRHSPSVEETQRLLRELRA